MHVDVAVVGAGPTGAIAAKHALAHDGGSVLVIEEHASIGSPVQCTGLLSTRALQECGCSPKNDYVLNSLRGAYLYSPDGTRLVIDGKKTKAYVVDRSMFDRELVMCSVDAGADLMLRTKAVSMSAFQDNKRRLTCRYMGKRIEIDANVIIGADGVASRVAVMAGIRTTPKRIITGAQVEAHYDVCDTDFVEIFTGKWAPGFFAWAVPIDDSTARIGLCTTAPDAKKHLDKLLDKHPVVSRQYRGGASDFVVGGIPLGTYDKTVTDGVMLAGDAAAQVKPTSGGGVYTGAVCAKLAGETAARFIQDARKENLAQYDKMWRESIGKELARGWYIHRGFARMSDEQLNKFVTSLNHPEIQDIITTYGDMDKPGILIRQLAMKKQTFGAVKALMPDFRDFLGR